MFLLKRYFLFVFSPFYSIFCVYNLFFFSNIEHLFYPLVTYSFIIQISIEIDYLISSLQLLVIICKNFM